MTSLTAVLGLLPAALANSIGSQAQKPLAIVVVGGMLVTLFLTRYLMPVLYSFFPAPAGHPQCGAELIEGSHYTDQYFEPQAAPAIVPRTTPRARTEPHGAAISSDTTTRISEETDHEARLETPPRPRGRSRASPAGWPSTTGPGAASSAAWNQLSGPSAHASEARPSKDWIESPGRDPGLLGRDAHASRPSRSRRSA